MYVLDVDYPSLINFNLISFMYKNFVSASKGRRKKNFFLYTYVNTPNNS